MSEYGMALVRERLGRLALKERWLAPEEELTLARAADVSVRETQLAAIEFGMTPERYRRSQQSLTREDQRVLLESRVALVGLGGLGGYVLEALVRMGVGTIRGADGDIFEPSNLNRQLLSETDALDRPKAEAAAARVARLNPAVDFEPVAEFLTEATVDAFLEGADVVVDALGGLDFRKPLKDAAERAGAPLVTAAVAGWCGVVAVTAPGGLSPADLLPAGGGVEDELGTPAPTVMLAGSLQAARVIHLLLGKGRPGEGLLFDLADGTFEPVRF